VLRVLVQLRFIEFLLLNLILVLVHHRYHRLVFGHYFDGLGQVDVEVGPLIVVIIEAAAVRVWLGVVEGCPEIGVFFALPHDGVVSGGGSLVGLHQLDVIRSDL